MAPLPYIFDFDSTDGTDRDLLGGKGAGLARMTSLGLPVPAGFTISTEACRHAMTTGAVPDGLWEEVGAAVERMAGKAGRTFGGGPVPLLVSVRSGAKFSMPGMMDTILNIGINDDVVKELIEWSGDPHFAWDAYRRFVQMYGNVVLGIDDHEFQAVLTDLRTFRGVDNDADLSTDDLESATRRFQTIIIGHHPAGLPTDPFDQLQGAISAVFDSWNGKRAIEYRKINRIPDDLGTAANVQTMVFGDMGDDSGTGVCFTRDPATGSRLSYGDYLPRAQGEDVVAGIRNTLSLDDLGSLHPECHAQLLEIMDGLESHYRDMCDIEFTIEKNTLYILQTRAGKRTAAAAVRMAVAMFNEGLIDKPTAVTRVEPASLEQLHRPRISSDVSLGTAMAMGVAASPGAASGRVVFTADDAVAWVESGEEVILVTQETTPDDIHGMAAARGILTSQGGKTSHAAVVARGMGKPAVTGAASVVVDDRALIATVAGQEIHQGEVITIDGTTGAVYRGEVAMVEPEPLPELGTLLGWADEIKSIGVRANADTPRDAALARERGARGIGLARTEHMFMGERLGIVRSIILAANQEERASALQHLETLQVSDFEAILEAMDGLPVVIRMLDPPLHEFLPSRLELEHEMLRRVRAGTPIDDLQHMSDQVARWEETNPMLGLRGVRLGLMLDNLYRMQARAAGAALVRRHEAGGDPRLEIMVPLVSDVEELARMRDLITEEITAAGAAAGMRLQIPIGTMIELPRAALTSGEIAKTAEFFSFGTNDLTQMTYGLSRDDAEGHFLREYLEQGIFASDPFQTLDQDGVGRLVRVATIEGREANPDLIVGLCGEHGGDPDSIAFVAGLGLDYVSCSPPRIEGARLAAAQATIAAGND